TMKQALVVAAVFEVSGAVLAGGSVTETVRSGIVDIDLHMDPLAFAYIMMAALLGAAIWLLLATRLGWPASPPPASTGRLPGAALAGGSVTATVRSGIVDIDLHMDPLAFAYIMMAALLGAAIWLLLATRMGWPVSTTHAIIGGIVGAAVTTGVVTGTGGFEMVQWGEIGQIAISWILSPLLGGITAYVLFG